MKRRRRRIVQANSESSSDGAEGGGEIDESEAEVGGKPSARSGQEVSTHAGAGREGFQKRRRIIASEQESSDCGATSPSSSTMRSPHPRELSALAAEMAETGVDLEKDPQLAAVIAVNLSTDLSVK
jgi:hypothetical protein